MREQLQRFGGFMAGMVIPNIGAFIAWGLITALFIPTGWTPNDTFVELVGPMIVNLLPLLIGYTGGKMIGGTRGGVMGAILTMGVIVGSDKPQFLGGMIAGPLGGWIIKNVDAFLEDKVPVGFEMLVNNFSIGILGAIGAMFMQVVIGPIMTGFSDAIGAVVTGMSNAGLLPLAAIFIEPAKVLFLNNAINHGVLTPLGAEAAAETGKAIHFMLESNPGPGLGLLIAYYVAGTGLLKQSAPGAMIIHFLGGIHEIYFPYVLAKPIMILAMIAGGLVGNLLFTLTGAGLVAAPSPGSIFAYLPLIPRGGALGVFAGIIGGAIAAAAVGMVLLRMSPVKADEKEEAYDDVSVPGLG